MEYNEKFIQSLIKEIKKWSKQKDSISLKQMFLIPFFQKHRLTKRTLDEIVMQFPRVEEEIFYTEALILHRLIKGSFESVYLTGREKNKWICLYDDYLREMDLKSKEMAAKAGAPIHQFFTESYANAKVDEKFQKEFDKRDVGKEL